MVFLETACNPSMDPKDAIATGDMVFLPDTQKLVSMYFWYSAYWLAHDIKKVAQPKSSTSLLTAGYNNYTVSQVRKLFHDAMEYLPEYADYMKQFKKTFKIIQAK